MTINPYTLNSLYNQGIIDHVPYDLCMGTPMTQSGLMESMGLSAPQMNMMNGGAMGMGMGQNPYASQQINGSQYLDSAMKGEMYGYYGNCNDSFTSATSSKKEQKSSMLKTMLGMGNGVGSEYDFKNAALDLNNGYGKGDDIERMANDKDGQDLRQSISNAASGIKENVMNSHPAVKGILATAGVILTVALAVKGLKKKPVVPKVSWWSGTKLNPKNWHFKK